MPSPAVPLVVLDTNVVLDWMLFNDPAGVAVGRAIHNGALAWIATSAMREEYFWVLGRSALAAWSQDQAAHRGAWHLHCQLRDTPKLTRVAPSPICADPADQMFVELALHEPATLLLTRDKAVLRLAVQMKTRGVVVATPRAWAATHVRARDSQLSPQGTRNESTTPQNITSCRAS